jgi:2-polyprenyl-3-methyl-5-hydroxy-6-metoxy-1,4-benzoquinol methylase
MTDLGFDANEIHYAACPICSGPISPLYRKAHAGKTFVIFQCSECHFGFVNPTPSLKYIVDFYTAAEHTPRTTREVLFEEESDPNSAMDARRLVTNLKSIVRGGDLLDAGCGYGFFSREAMRQGFAVDALEIADNERAIATEIAGIAPVAEMFETFITEKRYSAMIMSQVLEHAREPIKWLHKAKELMKPNGVLAVALPNFASMFATALKEKDPYVSPPAHLNYFNANNLVRLAKLNKLEVIKIETLTRFQAKPFISRLGQPLGHVGHKALSPLWPLIDFAKRGLMINAYFRYDPSL